MSSVESIGGDKCGAVGKGGAVDKNVGRHCIGLEKCERACVDVGGGVETHERIVT